MSDHDKPQGHGQANQNPDGMGLWALLREDRRNHHNTIWEQGFWALATHRFGNWRMGIRLKLLRFPFSIIYKILYKWVECTCGISLPYTVRVGRHVRIWHFGGIVIHAESIGHGVHIRHNTTIGVARTGQNFQLPVIEDNVDIGVGAVIIGPITVGRGTVIGANAVVNRDIPPYSLAVGVPARVIRRLSNPDDVDKCVNSDRIDPSGVKTGQRSEFGDS